MSMFCYQCQETSKNMGCTVVGVCGKSEETANMQDLLLFVLRGIAVLDERARRAGIRSGDAGRFVVSALFSTVTNVSFDVERGAGLVQKALAIRNRLRDELTAKGAAESLADLPDEATWEGGAASFAAKALTAGVLATGDEDVRSLRQLVTCGIKGIAAYAHHAEVLGREDVRIYDFLMEALAATTKDLTADELTALVLETGEVAVTTMALLDGANTGAYGDPEITEVNIGVRTNPGILVTGHDLKDLTELLEQTKDTGVDVYTHGEMMPAHSYPAFKKYDHLVGNYGGSWWKQKREFESFRGAILMTTNCIVPVEDSYKDRIFTTGVAAYPGVEHVADRPPGGTKDFSKVIAKARECDPPVELETGTIVVGFAHNQVLQLADKIVEAVESGAIKRFIVMAGCDGRQRSREYFTDVAKALPPDTVILTAGCAKYRYNKLDLGDVGGIPRVLDAGQCNDSYSLAVIALKLKEAFGLDNINDLPISFDIAWYEQKAVTVLLALLHLGVKGIRLGPTLPAFLSPDVANVLVDKFDIKPIGDVHSDVEAMVSGR